MRKKPCANLIVAASFYGILLFISLANYQETSLISEKIHTSFLAKTEIFGSGCLATVFESDARLRSFLPSKHFSW